jgi:hypothetical protein
LYNFEKTTPTANFSTSVVDTCGKFATGVSDDGGKLPPTSMTPVANNENKWDQTADKLK